MPDNHNEPLYKTFSDDLSKIIEAVCFEFEAAEKRIKKVEHCEPDGLDIPSINELRYVAFHLIATLQGKSEEERLEQARKAKGHAQRASYDAVETGIINRLEEFRQFESDYRLVIKSTIIPEYASYKAQAAKILKDLERIRGDELPKEDYYIEAEQYYDDLVEITDKLKNSREDLNLKRRSDKQKAVGAVIALLLAAAALLPIESLITRSFFTSVDASTEVHTSLP